MEAMFLKPRETAMSASLNLDQQELDAALANAVFSEAEDLVQSLLAAGSNPNRANLFGRTPLHLAARKTSIEVVNALLAAGADPNARDVNDETPVYGTTYNWTWTSIGDWGPAIVSDLLSAGADPDVRNREGLLSDDYAEEDLREVFAAHRASLEEKALLDCLAPAKAPLRSSAL